MNDPQNNGLKILSVKDVCSRLSCSRSWLYERLNERSPYYDEMLPTPVRYGSRVGFIEHEVDNFIRGLMQARLEVDNFIRGLKQAKGGDTDE